MYWPPWCKDIEDHWPWTHPRQGLHLITLSFDAKEFDGDDFSLCGIQTTEAVKRSNRKRQAEFLAGRLCAGEALHRVLGNRHYPAAQRSGAPLWPQGSVGSITHTDGQAAAIAGDISRYRALGLDVESLIPDQSARGLIRRVLTPGERSRFQNELDIRPGYLLTLAFSLKESLFKALYPPTLRRFYFQDAELSSWTADGQARLRLAKTLSPEWMATTEIGAQFSVDEGRLTSVVVVEAE